MKRLRSEAFFRRALPLLGVEGKEDLARRLERIPSEEPLVHMGFSRIVGGSLASILQLDRIATVA